MITYDHDHTSGSPFDTLRGFYDRINLGPRDGLPRRCAVNLDTITTIPKSSLVQLVSFLNAEKLHAVNEAVKFALDLP